VSRGDLVKGRESEKDHCVCSAEELNEPNSTVSEAQQVGRCVTVSSHWRRSQVGGSASKATIGVARRVTSSFGSSGICDHGDLASTRTRWSLHHLVCSRGGVRSQGKTVPLPERGCIGLAHGRGLIVTQPGIGVVNWVGSQGDKLCRGSPIGTVLAIIEFEQVKLS
jgi:hypothetical protein